jgi:quinoprotein glucose dehydrogenase
MKKFVVVVLAIVVILMLPVLGGSMVWMLGGADGLDVKGTARMTDRPAVSITAGDGWEHWGGDAGGSRYSKLDQINTGNVSQLSVAWMYRTGDLEHRPDAIRQSATEGTPILVENSLVFCTPFNEVIAVLPTGEIRPAMAPAPAAS